MRRLAALCLFALYAAGIVTCAVVFGFWVYGLTQAGWR